MKKILSPSALVETLNTRYATKAFDPAKPISAEDEHALLESLRLAPSSFGLQPWRWIVVKNKDIRTKLRAVSWNQSQVEDASLYVVFAIRKGVDAAYIKKFVEQTEMVRGLPAGTLAGYYDMMVGGVANGKNPEEQRSWAAKQSYIAMGFLGLSASLLGIDACMMEWFDPAAYDTILGLEDSEYASVASVALGYRSADDKYADLAKVRFAKEDVIEVMA